VDSGNVLLPRPRLQSPLTDALRETVNTSPPDNFPMQTDTSADHLVTLHYHSRSSGSANGVLAEIVSILHDRLQTRLGFSLKHNVDIWNYRQGPDSPRTLARG
jgi:hypothetical protein